MGGGVIPKIENFKNPSNHYKITKKWVYSVWDIYKPVSGGLLTFHPHYHYFDIKIMENMYFLVWWHNFGTWKMHQNHPKNDQNHWKITKISFYVHLGTCIHIYGSLGVIRTSFRVFEIFPTENPFKNAPKHTKWPANHSFRGLKYVKSGLKSPKIDQNMVKTPNSTPQTHINLNRPHKENARMADF